jgi:outer membrane protein TolC
MKTTTLLILLTTSLSLGNRIAAEGGEDIAGSTRVSLADVTRLVLENNPAIKEAEQRWRAARERVRQAYAWEIPALPVNPACAALWIYRPMRSWISRLSLSN